jgi:uncharacterized coiled-coil protein SlyX
MDDKKIIDLINDAIMKTKSELFPVIDSLNNKIEAQDIVIKELKKQIMFDNDQIDDLDNTLSEITDRLNICKHQKGLQLKSGKNTRL